MTEKVIPKKVVPPPAEERRQIEQKALQAAVKMTEESKRRAPTHLSGELSTRRINIL